MLVQMRRFTVTEGNAHQLVENLQHKKHLLKAEKVLLIKRYYRKKCVAVKKK